jgi:catechol 2,3-dioxygenase-like lactoylglutathione lyase family enzyme
LRTEGVRIAVMFGTFDHVGYLVLDLDAGLAQAQEVLGLPLARTLELPQYGISAAFLGEGSGTLEIFTVADGDARAARLGTDERRLDHVAFRVDDLDALAATLRAAGARFTGPDRRGELAEPLALGGARHLWSLPETTAGLALQLIEPPGR